MSSTQRLATLPDVPTAKELGVELPDEHLGRHFRAARACRREIVEKLAGALDKSLDDPSVQKRLADLGGAMPAKDERTPAKFEAFVKAEIARWSPILKAAGAKTN